MAKILVTSEMIIQRLLSEAGVGGIGDELVSVDARGIEAAAVSGSLKSPENMSGTVPITLRHPAVSGGIQRYDALTSFDKLHIYAIPSRLRLNDWALSGD
jgi:hypothetical protein